MACPFMAVMGCWQAKAILLFCLVMLSAPCGGVKSAHFPLAQTRRAAAPAAFASPAPAAVPALGRRAARRAPLAATPAVRCSGRPPDRGRSALVSACASTPPAAEGDVLVLGAGWVGSRLALRLHESGLGVRVTNRPGTAVGAKEPYFQGVELPEVVRRHEFDVTVPESWAGLPDPASLRAVVITFPMQLASVEPFWEAFLRRVPSVVAFSSTSVYQVDVPGQTVDEGTQIKATPRAMAEAYMQERGAAVLTISGIFGEPRGPRGVCTCLAFYSSGGGGLNGAKSVNMVHVCDIIEATERCAPPAPSPARRPPPGLPGPTPLETDAARAHHLRSCIVNPRPGLRVNVGGTHFYLRELIAHCDHPTAPEAPDTDLSSKRISSECLCSEVIPGFSFIGPFDGRELDEPQPANGAAKEGALASSENK